MSLNLNFTLVSKNNQVKKGLLKVMQRLNKENHYYCFYSFRITPSLFIMLDEVCSHKKFHLAIKSPFFFGPGEGYWRRRETLGEGLNPYM